MQRLRETAQLFEGALSSGCDLGRADADLPRLATEELLIGPPQVGAMLLEQMPLIANHRVELFEVLGKLGHNSNEFAGGIESETRGLILSVVPNAAQGVDTALNVRCVGPLRFRFTTLQATAPELG
jgi:hypothetical protein